MPLLVPEPAVVDRGLEAAKFCAHGAVDQLSQIMRDLDIRAETEEHIAVLAGRALLAPDPTIAEMGDRADAVVQRNALLAKSLVDPPLARRRAQFDVGERQIMSIQQLGDLGGRRQRLVLGAAIGDRLGTQRLNAELQLVECSWIGCLIHRSPVRVNPTDRTRSDKPAEGVSCQLY